MSFSGFKGKVWVVNQHCPTYPLNGNTPVGHPAKQWHDEVTEFTVVESAKKEEYGHDKSGGWQDLCYGTRRLGITLNAKAHNQTTSLGGFHAGQVVYLELFPFGVNAAGTLGCGTPLTGYAGVDQVSYTVDINNGMPVAYTMTLSSKGPWVGLPGGSRPWGGFECECQGGPASQTPDPFDSLGVSTAL